MQSVSGDSGKDLQGYSALDIIYLLRKAEFPASKIAEELGITVQTVSSVIHAATKSTRVASKVAEILGKTPHEIWPDKYPPPDTESIEEGSDTACKQNVAPLAP